MWAHLYSYWAVDPELMSAFPILRPCFRPCQSEMIYILKEIKWVQGFLHSNVTLSSCYNFWWVIQGWKYSQHCRDGKQLMEVWCSPWELHSYVDKSWYVQRRPSQKDSSRQAFKRDQKQGHGFWKQTALIPKLKSATYFLDKWLYFLCHSFCIHSLRQDNGKCMKVKKSVDNACKYTTKNEQAPPHLAKNAKLLSSSVNVYGIIHFRDL